MTIIWKFYRTKLRFYKIWDIIGVCNLKRWHVCVSRIQSFRAGKYPGLVVDKNPKIITRLKGKRYRVFIVLTPLKNENESSFKKKKKNDKPAVFQTAYRVKATKSAKQDKNAVNTFTVFYRVDVNWFYEYLAKYTWIIFGFSRRHFCQVHTLLVAPIIVFRLNGRRSAFESVLLTPNWQNRWRA